MGHNLLLTSSSSIPFAFCPHRIVQPWLPAFPCFHLPGFWFSGAHGSQGNRGHELTVLFCFWLWCRWAYGSLSSLLLPIPSRPNPAARQHLWWHGRVRYCVAELREEHCGLRNLLRITTYKQKSGILLVCKALDKTLFSKHCVYWLMNFGDYRCFPKKTVFIVFRDTGHYEMFDWQTWFGSKYVYLLFPLFVI